MATRLFGPGRPERPARRWSMLIVGALLGAAALAGAGFGSELLRASPAPDSAPPVVLAHGLGRSPASMAILASRLEHAGFRVVPFGYPSRSEPMETLVARLADGVAECCGDDPGGVHFVTHSMGGVLVRAYLAQLADPHDGRVVMLSPPSRGSEIVAAVADADLFRPLLGPAGLRLSTSPDGIARQLRPIRFRLGIITGNRSLNPIGSWIIPGPDDGAVGVDQARIDGASFLVLPATHTFIMNRRDVADEVAHFLRHGRFEREAD